MKPTASGPNSSFQIPVAEKDLVSIVVPIYKVEAYLEKCLLSITNQTYLNLEIILVDDGSPDRCGNICDAFAAKDPRIKVIHKQNEGLSQARNVGIEIATGAYITFIDSDDWVHEEYVETLHRLMQTKETDISVCNFLATADEELETSDGDSETYTFSNIEALQQYSDTFYVQMVVAWGKLYKKDLFTGVRYPTGRLHEDEFTTHKLLYKARRVALTTRPLLFYRQREDSIMGNGFDLRHGLDTVDALLERAAFYDSKGLECLRDSTNRIAFHVFRKLFKYAREHPEEEIGEPYYRKFQELKRSLNAGKHKTRFVIFYQCYALSPSLFDRLFEIYVSWKQFLIRRDNQQPG